VRESNAETEATTPDDGILDNRFSGASGNKLPQKKCGWQAFMQRIVGGEICEIDEFPWAALLLYESSGNHSLTLSHILINFCANSCRVNESNVECMRRCVAEQKICADSG
jgi:hypothetical protein